MLIKPIYTAGEAYSFAQEFLKTHDIFEVNLKETHLVPEDFLRYHVVLCIMYYVLNSIYTICIIPSYTLSTRTPIRRAGTYIFVLNPFYLPYTLLHIHFYPLYLYTLYIHFCRYFYNAGVCCIASGQVPI
jgi:hypothetical protein